MWFGGVVAHQISVVGPNGEQLYTLEQWLDMDLRRRIEEIRQGRVRVMVGGQLVPPKVALASVKEWLGSARPRRERT